MKMAEGLQRRETAINIGLVGEKRKVSMNLCFLDKKEGETITKHNVTSYLLKIKIVWMIIITSGQDLNKIY